MLKIKFTDFISERVSTTRARRVLEAKRGDTNINNILRIDLGVDTDMVRKYKKQGANYRSGEYVFQPEYEYFDHGDGDGIYVVYGPLYRNGAYESVAIGVMTTYPDGSTKFIDIIFTDGDTESLYANHHATRTVEDCVNSSAPGPGRGSAGMSSLWEDDYDKEHDEEHDDIKWDGSLFERRKR